jgi:hypothetical protein
MDGGPTAGKRLMSQGPRGCAGSPGPASLGDGGHIAARLVVNQTAGAGQVQSMGPWACSSKL